MRSCHPGRGARVPRRDVGAWTAAPALAAALLAVASGPQATAAPSAAPVVERMAPPAPQVGELPLPSAGSGVGAEQWDRFLGQVIVRNVSRPTITPFLPDPAKATGAAVVVLPGGGFQFVSVENEGWNVARRLAASGVAAFVVKYRLNATPVDEAAFVADLKTTFSAIASGADPAALHDPDATEDALAALRRVRAGAAKWGVDPRRVGLLGFSAGADAAMRATLAAPAAERPAFLGYVYGPKPAAPVPADAPPLFVALAMDDTLLGDQGIGVAQAWRRAGRPVELHAYGAGGHGFGVGKPGTTSTLLLDEFQAWLASRGLLTAGSAPVQAGGAAPARQSASGR